MMVVNKTNNSQEYNYNNNKKNKFEYKTNFNIIKNIQMK